LRYLKPERDNIFISIIGLISILGVTVGVTAIVLVLSILNGFEREVKSRFIGFDAHLKVRPKNDESMADWKTLADSLNGVLSVIGVSPFIQEKAVVTSRQGNRVAFVKGTLESTIGTVSSLNRNLSAGSLRFEPRNGGLPGIVVGYSMDLNLETNLGDTITVISPVGVTSPFSVPAARRFELSGVFKTDMFEYDNAYAFIGLPEAQALFEQEQGVQGLDIKLGRVEDSWDVQRQLQERLGDGFVVETWYDQHADLYTAMALEKWGSLILLSLIILVASFNIVSTLIMVVMQKTPEIGILQSMGADSRMISGIFVRQGLWVGGVGVLVGTLTGYSICFLQIQYRFIKLPADIFFLDALPMELKWVDFLAVITVSLVICLFSTFYPARKASRLLPVEALRS
jgi:lipoprotein-releasing system permease protein